MKIRTILYIAVIVLINIASTTLFIRFDLTENRSYSLSESSKNLVANLEEPLTIKVFLSENLPVPYNTLERDIRDILGEYEIKANRHFNYTIDLIKKDETPTVSPETYGIYPVNIQSIEEDEMKVVSAYIGMTFIHGDLSETLPAVQYNENLEFTITKTIRSLTEKTTALLGLEENIKLKLIISPILKELSSDFITYRDDLNRVIDTINGDYFNRLTLEFIEPDQGDIESLAKNFSLNTLSLEDGNREVIPALASLVIDSGDEQKAIELITTDLFRRTVIVSPNQLEESIRSSIDKLVGSETAIGYLVSHGTIPMGQNQMMFQQNQEPTVNGFNQIVTDSYNLLQVDLKDGEIPEDIKTLVIARPREEFSQREIYLLDQFVLKGNSLLLALDQFEPDMQMAQYGQEKYNPINHGLEDFLSHHGIKIEKNLVLDETSFKQVQRDGQGSLVENQIYFAPMIEQNNINDDLTFMKGINELITFKFSQVGPVSEEDDSVDVLFTTTDKGWTSNLETLTMNPGRLFPSGDQKKLPMAAIKRGSFNSFFSGKEIPAREFKEQESEDDISTLEGIGEKETIVETSNRGRILVFGSGDILTDQLVTGNFKSNVLLVQNSIDYLSGRGDYTQMRSKGVFSRPMVETKPAQRNFIKTFNIVILPLLVGLAGLLAYFLWNQKKRRIMSIFQGGSNEK